MLNLGEILTDSIHQDSSMIFHKHFLEASWLSHLKVGSFVNWFLMRVIFPNLDLTETLKSDVKDVFIVDPKRQLVFDGDVGLKDWAGKEWGIGMYVCISLSVCHLLYLKFLFFIFKSQLHYLLMLNFLSLQSKLIVSYIFCFDRGKTLLKEFKWPILPFSGPFIL